MALKQTVAPTIEPLTLAEVKAHLRIDSVSLADDVSSLQTIAPGDHVVAAAYSLVGSSVEVLGYSILVVLEAGQNGAGGTVDVKLQDSDNGTTWTDVTGGAFTQVTEANDNATQELAYTGTRRYLRAVATVASATCDFGVSIIRDASTSVEDDLLNSLITAARQYCENFQNRAYLTQTWELWLDEFPDKDGIQIPLPPLASITSIKYYDIGDTEYTLAATEYFVDTKSEPGWVVLNYAKVWPTITLRPANGVCITFVAGEAAAASVRKAWKQAMLLAIGHLYEHRDDDAPMPRAVDSLLWQDRIF